MAESLDLPPAFKSRFLKTEKSTALKKQQQADQPTAPLLVNTSTSIGLRSLRSTFSPLAKLPENVEVRNTENPSGDDKLSKNIKAFIERTDHVQKEWNNLGQKRAGSVDRDQQSSLYLPKSYHQPSHSVRAASVAPISSSQ